MAELLTALALAIALEGILYALFPATMRRFILQVLEMPDAGLRMAGLVAAVVAVAAIATIRFILV
ncbi:MAG: hypothetical protein CMM45_08980 [Rhodospirillaceae bacterium]|nr:hypothetical protein [Rhodospirillaceae bacterium]